MAEDTTGRDLAHRSPGWLCFGIAVVALVAGQALLWVKPVWLAPPMATTLLIYLVLAWVWLPIAVICLVRMPRGEARWAPSCWRSYSACWDVLPVSTAA